MKQVVIQVGAVAVVSVAVLLIRVFWGRCSRHKQRQKEDQEKSDEEEVLIQERTFDLQQPLLENIPDAQEVDIQQQPQQQQQAQLDQIYQHSENDQNNHSDQICSIGEYLGLRSDQQRVGVEEQRVGAGVEEGVEGQGLGFRKSLTQQIPEYELDQKVLESYPEDIQYMEFQNDQQRSLNQSESQEVWQAVLNYEGQQQAQHSAQQEQQSSSQQQHNQQQAKQQANSDGQQVQKDQNKEGMQSVWGGIKERQKKQWSGTVVSPRDDLEVGHIRRSTTLVPQGQQEQGSFVQGGVKDRTYSLQELSLTPLSSDEVDALTQQQSQLQALNLEVIGGPSQGQTVTWQPTPKKYLVGRQPDCDLFIQDMEVSSRHLRIEAKSGKWFVTDMGSLNGTQLNGKIISRPNRMESASLVINAEDEIIVGRASSIKATLLPLQNSPTNTSRTKYQLNGQIIEIQQHFPPSADLLLSPRHNQDKQHIKTFHNTANGLRVYGAGLLNHGIEHRRNGLDREDYYTWQVPLQNCGGGQQRVLGVAGVFDGHGGGEAALSCAALLPKILGSEIAKVQGRRLSQGGGLQKQFKDAFLEADRQIVEDSGCTATLLVFGRDGREDGEEEEEETVFYQVGNVGDSSAIAVLINGGTDSRYEILTQDHKVRSEGERQRLDALGVPRSHGNSRIYGLNLARTIGDRYVKEEVELTGVIAEPHVSNAYTLQPQQQALIIIASDGLWDVVTYEHVADIVTELNTQLSSDEQTTQQQKLSRIVEQLAEIAVKKGSRDDIGIVAIQLEG